MMFVSLGLGTLLALALITTVSLLTSGRATPTGQSTTTLPNALVGQSVAGFHVAGLDGAQIGAPYAAGHPTVLIFFASWCGPCQAEMPKVSAYLRSHHEGPVQVIGVDTNDQRASALQFVHRVGATFPIVFDANTNVSNGIFQLQALPDTVFVNAKGVVTQIYIGAIPTTTLAHDIAVLARS